MTNSSSGSIVANTVGSVTFACPKCLATTIVRSRNEREIASKYVCSECNFTGPN